VIDNGLFITQQIEETRRLRKANASSCKQRSAAVRYINKSPRS